VFTAALATVALASAWIPARRAANITPLAALRARMIMRRNGEKRRRGRWQQAGQVV
jgi:hypothetical protein